MIRDHQDDTAEDWAVNAAASKLACMGRRKRWVHLLNPANNTDSPRSLCLTLHLFIAGDFMIPKVMFALIQKFAFVLVIIQSTLT